MSRTAHTRARRKRSDPTISAKKPDEGRRWQRRFRKNHDIAPVRDLRKKLASDE